MGTSLLWQTDAQLRDAVWRELERESAADVRAMELTASEGVITLVGFVNSHAERLVAERAVKRVRGVRALASNLRVKRVDQRTDTDIAKDALQALQAQTSVASQVTVTVRHGTVTLDGAVEWMYQKTAAESAVMYLTGVKEVLNRIRIAPVGSPRTVEVNIEAALRRSAEIDAHQIAVTVDDGAITLVGRVHSQVERQEAEEAARAAPGVASVENRIVVEP